mmetsp:Transcript_28293/g.63185  ORF Transcript_28293/g.63185 Transcript_28293/m.63185 type:complete len:368 (-) Transcript_28293:77-1180(-)
MPGQILHQVVDRREARDDLRRGAADDGGGDRAPPGGADGHPALLPHASPARVWQAEHVVRLRRALAQGPGGGDQLRRQVRLQRGRGAHRPQHPHVPAPAAGAQAQGDRQGGGPAHGRGDRGAPGGHAPRGGHPGRHPGRHARRPDAPQQNARPAPDPPLRGPRHHGVLRVLHGLPAGAAPAGPGQGEGGGAAGAQGAGRGDGGGPGGAQVLPDGHAGDPALVHHHPLREPDRLQGPHAQGVGEDHPLGDHRPAPPRDHEPRPGPVGRAQRVPAGAVRGDHLPLLGQARLPPLWVRLEDLHRQHFGPVRGGGDDLAPHAEVPPLSRGRVQGRGHRGDLHGLQEWDQGSDRGRRGGHHRQREAALKNTN